MPRIEHIERIERIERIGRIEHIEHIERIARIERIERIEQDRHPLYKALFRTGKYTVACMPISREYYFFCLRRAHMLLGVYVSRSSLQGLKSKHMSLKPAIHSLDTR
jgi:hypothetical protein